MPANTHALLRTIKKIALAEDIAEHLLTLIRARAGDKLPPERELPR